MSEENHEANGDAPSQRSYKAVDRQRARRVLRDARYYAEHKAEILARRRARYHEIRAGPLALAKRQAQTRAKRLGANAAKALAARGQQPNANANLPTTKGAGTKSAASSALPPASTSKASKTGAKKKKSTQSAKQASSKAKMTSTARKRSYYEANRGAILARRREHYNLKKDQIQARRRERYRIRQSERQNALDGLASETMEPVENTGNC